MRPTRIQQQSGKDAVMIQTKPKPYEHNDQFKARCWDVLHARILDTRTDIQLARRMLWEMADVEKQMQVAVKVIDEQRNLPS
jgi:hypothetical protein